MTILYKDGDQICFDKQLLDDMRSEDNVKVRSILENENIVDMKDSSEATLLHYAAEFGNWEITKYLIDKGLNVDAQDSRQQTPLLLAVVDDLNNISPETVEVLLQANANMFIVDCFGEWPLKTVLYWISFRRIGVIEMFLKKLEIVCKYDDAMIVDILMEAECPIERATLLRNSSLLGMMIDRGCPVDDRHPLIGHTALHAAVHLMDLDNVKLLVERGADVNAIDFEGRIPLFYYNYSKIREVQQPEIIRFVINENTQLTRLENNQSYMQISTVLLHGNNEAIKTLLGYDIDFSAKTQQGRTVLHFLASNNDSAIPCDLEGKEFDVNARDALDNTPLFYAMYAKNVNIVQFLLEKGAEVNVINAVGWTPLIYSYSDISCIKKHDKIVELLFQHGGNFDMIDTERKTVFDIVTKRRKFDFVKTLLAHLAVLEKLGEPLTELLLIKINSHAMFKNYFESCMRKLQRMDNIVINDSMTMFTIYIEPEEKIVGRCIYNPTLLSKLISMNRKWHSNFYYFGIVQKRLDRIVRKVILIRNSTFVVCKILGLHNNENHIIVHKIIKYLDYDDMLILSGLESPTY